MKDLLKKLDKAFENRVRLGIMSSLVVNEYLDFNAIKQLLGLTDGNLASHMKALEKKEYVAFEKEFLGRKPKTKYFATKKGVKAFEAHINALEQIIKNDHK